MKKKLIITLFCSIFISMPLTIAQNTKDNRSFEISKNLDIINSILREIDLFYVDTIELESFVKKGIDYMLGQLDPYTVYIPEKKSEEITRITTGEYGGIGSIIMQHKKQIVISEPYEQMPAQKAGLKCGDIIVAIDGEKMTGKTTLEVSNRLKGAPGTSLTIEIKRPDEKKHIKKTIIRKNIQLHPVDYYSKISPNIGYVMLSEFNNKAYTEFKNAVDDLVNNSHIESLIIDLRNNGGGLIDEAVNIAGLFLPKGTEVVSTKGKINQQQYHIKTTREPLYPNLPIAVLVNRSSASAAEILAGAFQDLDRAIIVGERTYGKGLVQNIRNIDYKGYVKITTAKYYTPSGRCVQAIDYTHRNDDGSVGRIPDSLTHQFKTKLGRLVRDGGGIMPDSIINYDKKINISYYLYTQNLIFDFATQFAKENKQIASPETFNLSDSDYEKFVKFVKKQNFSYHIQSEQVLKELKETVALEGYDTLISDEIKKLEKILQPNIDKDMLLFKSDIIDLINYEIIKRYYFQKGMIRYGLRDDEWLKKAIEALEAKK